MSTNAHTIGGIDPGLASGGFVVVKAARNEELVLFSRSLVPPRGTVSEAKIVSSTARARLNGWGDREFIEADSRARAWVLIFLAAWAEFEAEHGEIEIFAIESFVDLHSKAKLMLKNRWHTPLVIGYLSAELRARGYTVENGRIVFQNPSTLAQFSYELASLDARKKPYPVDLVLRGDELVGNSHEARALAHALALANHLTAVTTSPSIPVAS